jgi:hypothetical protein
MKLTKTKLKQIIKEEISSDLETTTEKKKIFVLVGPPSVGKSHWMKSTFGDSAPYVINRDDIVNQVAGGMGWTYDDMYVPPSKEAKEGDVDPKYGAVVKSPSYMTWQPLSYDKVAAANNEVHSLFTQRVAGANPSGQDIVVDMTNMNARAREGALKAIEGAEGEYEKIAVVFKFEGAEAIIKKVAAKRAAQAKAEGKSKTIPPEAFDRMFKSFQEIDSSEGFDEVISVDNTAALQQLVSGEPPSVQKNLEERKLTNKVKITKSKLKQLIKEETSKVLRETSYRRTGYGLDHRFN